MRRMDDDVSRDAIHEAAAIDSLQGARPMAPGDESRLDAEYRAARTTFDEVTALLGFSARPVDPPAGLKKRLLSRIRPSVLVNQPEAPLTVKPGVTAVRTDDIEWIAAPLPGVFYKVLNHDPERLLTTRLVRFEPGLRYPNHRHGGTEEIYLIQGEVTVNGITLRAGDYCRSEAGTEEFGTSTETGALALVVSSDLDEVGIDA